MQINETGITYMHRGTLGNLKKNQWKFHWKMEKGILILDEGTQIPYHRIVKIKINNKIYGKSDSKFIGDF